MSRYGINATSGLYSHEGKLAEVSPLLPLLRLGCGGENQKFTNWKDILRRGDLGANDRKPTELPEFLARTRSKRIHCERCPRKGN